MLIARSSRALPLAALLILVIMLQGAAGLFALWRNQAEQARSRNELAAIGAMLDAARTAQTAFHIQVQEWKNILLRGQDPALRSRHETAFRVQSEEVERSLATLGARGGAAIARHAAINQRYAAVLAEAQLASGDGARAADAQLRGVDRDLQAMLEALANAVLTDHGAALQAAALREAEAYASQRSFLLICGMVGLIATLGLLLAAARR